MRTYIDELSDNPIVIDDEDDGDDPATYVTVTVELPDDSEIEGSVSVVAEPVTPDAMARLIVRAALGAAAAHGTDTWIALQQLLAPTPPRRTR